MRGEMRHVARAFIPGWILNPRCRLDIYKWNKFNFSREKGEEEDKSVRRKELIILRGMLE